MFIDPYMSDPPYEGMVYDEAGYRAAKSSSSKVGRVFWWTMGSGLIGMSVASSVPILGLSLLALCVGSMCWLWSLFDRHKAILDGHLEKVALGKAREAAAMEHARNSQGTTNQVTITLGPGASFLGPVNVGENIRSAYNTASSTKDNLRPRLESLIQAVGKLIESTPDNEKKADISSQLKMLVEEARKPEPSAWAMEISSKGLLDAAKAVASLASPVAESVRAVLELVQLSK